MSNFVYTPAKQKLAKGDLDFDVVDLRVKLVMTDTTADTEQDAANLTAITTLDEYDGSGYAEIDLANLAVNQDDPNDRSEIDADNGNFGTAVAAGTRQAQAALYYVRVDGTPGNDYPVAYVDTVSTGPTFPFDGNGGQINWNIDAEGALQVA
jgi:hypothetical protein